MSVERDLALSEHLNRDIDNLCDWLNFRNKSYVFFVFLGSGPRVSY
jgi:hypothetical protein